MRYSSLAVAALAVLAVACKKKDAAPAAATPPAAAAAAPAPATPMAAVTAVEIGRHLGEDKRVSDTTSVFAPKDTLYLAVATENTAPGATLLAKWTFQTGQTLDSTSQAVAAPGPGALGTVSEFHLVKPSGWPVGKYKVEVWLDGVSKGVKEFEVKR
ncbi:MAG: hypothetical protein JNJ98_17245 [Gemmatimonadetes bacterium]|nr:hypothetical protein [Gemmatimonadota bacterium]